MSRKNTSAIVNKFTVWGVAFVVFGIAFAVLAVVINDFNTVTMVALPVTLFGAALFYRNHLDQKQKR